MTANLGIRSKNILVFIYAVTLASQTAHSSCPLPSSTLLCAIIEIMSKLIEYPMDLPPLTPEEKAESRRIIAEAKAKGHPLAEFAGIFMDDPTFNEWQRAIHEYRQSVEDNPEI